MIGSNTVKRVIIEGSTTSANVVPAVALITVFPALPINPKAIGNITATTIRATANKITSLILAIYKKTTPNSNEKIKGVNIYNENAFINLTINFISMCNTQRIWM